MKKLLPPTHLEPEYLYKKYELLRKATYARFRNKMNKEADREDLMGTIDQIFYQLVLEYDPDRGVDFPYYIKRMLDLRVYHHITKYFKTVNSESYDEKEIVVEDTTMQDVLQKVIDLNSIDPNIHLGEKHRKLLIGILIEKKTIKELAEEEGVPPDKIHARFYFLQKKLRAVYESQVDEFGEDMY